MSSRTFPLKTTLCAPIAISTVFLSTVIATPVTLADEEPTPMGEALPVTTQPSPTHASPANPSTSVAPSPLLTPAPGPVTTSRPVASSAITLQQVRSVKSGDSVHTVSAKISPASPDASPSYVAIYRVGGQGKIHDVRDVAVDGVRARANVVGIHPHTRVTVNDLPTYADVIVLDLSSWTIRTPSALTFQLTLDDDVADGATYHIGSDVLAARLGLTEPTSSLPTTTPSSTNPNDKPTGTSSSSTSAETTTSTTATTETSSTASGRERMGRAAVDEECEKTLVDKSTGITDINYCRLKVEKSNNIFTSSERTFILQIQEDTQLHAVSIIPKGGDLNPNGLGKLESVKIDHRPLDPSAYQHSFFKDDQGNSRLYIVFRDPVPVTTKTFLTVTARGMSWGTPSTPDEYSIGLYGPDPDPGNPTKDKFSMTVEKYGLNENGEVDFTSQPLNGAEFTLYDYRFSDDGQGEYSNPRGLTATDKGLSIDNLEPGVYALTETKSPEGFELLPNAFIFEVMDAGKGYTLRPARDYSFIQWSMSNDTHGVIKIADIRQTGSLPRTGGWGVFAPMLVGLLMIGGAVALSRRWGRRA